MADYLNVYILDPDTGLKKTAVLQNAFRITETQELNKIYQLDFSIPTTDAKTKYILPFHYVRYGEKGQLYRIIKINYEDSDTSILNVSCEHVIALLCDELMFGAIQYGGGTIRTSGVISYLLDRQETKNWELKDCDFDRKFEYLWEQENILNALYSIPKEFVKAYKWTFDTTGYPWEISLKKIEAAHPEFYIRAKRNLLSSGSDQDYTGVCTRIYPLGYGEGVNQLTIKDARVNRNTGEVDTVNGVKYGKTYIESPQQIIAQYGIKEKVLVDRRFENAESLYTYGKTVLEGLQTPSMARSFDVVDLYPFTSQDIDRAEVGKICKMTGDDTIAYITKTIRVLDDPGNLQIELSTKATDVVSTIADLADRVRIESVYAQGATQLYQHSKDANATPQKGMVMSLYFPSEMRQINKVLMRLKLGQFRSYSQTTSSNGGFSQDYTVAESSQTYTVAASEKDYTVAESSQTYTVAASEKKITENYSKTATTDMTADAEQNLTTTVGGGGSGTTSPSIGENTINIYSTTETKWEGDETNAYSGGSKVTVNVQSKSIWPEGHKATDTPNSSQFENHGHYIYDYLSHDHEASGSLESVPIPKNQFAHSHPINLTGVGAHSHSFTVGDHSHKINIAHQHKYDLSHEHTITIPGHSHTIKIPGHKHTITIPGHSHTIKIPGHKHTITIPAHSHNIAAGIFESGNPTGFTVFVNGTQKKQLQTIINGKIIKSNADGLLQSKSFDGDITSWILDGNDQIPRDSWIEIEIRPNDNAYIVSSVFVQGFVQSRGGGNF